jgi:hypothetical protein
MNAPMDILPCDACSLWNFPHLGYGRLRLFHRKQNLRWNNRLPKSGLKPAFSIKSKVAGQAELVSPKLKFWNSLGFLSCLVLSYPIPL